MSTTVEQMLKLPTEQIAGRLDVAIHALEELCFVIEALEEPISTLRQQGHFAPSAAATALLFRARDLSDAAFGVLTDDRADVEQNGDIVDFGRARVLT